MLKDYDMSVLYHPGKANVIIDAFSHMTMGIFSHVEEVNKNLAKDVHRFSILGARLKDSPNGDFVVLHNSKSSLMVEVKYKKHLDLLLMEFKESVLSNMNESFS